MILHQYTNDSYLSQKIRLFWVTFKEDILKYTSIEFKEEDLKGSSFCQYRTMQYYNVLYLLIMIYLDVQRWGTLHPNWSYYITKYDLDTKRKCLACYNIDLDKALATFNFPLTPCIGGIECIAPEESFEVEPSSIPTTSTITTISLPILMAEPSRCLFTPSTA